MQTSRVVVACALAALYAGLARTDCLGARTILDLQPFKRSTSIAIDASGARGTATLLNLNPRINTWYVLALDWDGADGREYFHLENPAPLHQTVDLDRDTGRGLVLRTDRGEIACELWSTRAKAPLEQAHSLASSYAPLCDGRLYLRNPSVGYRTARELVTEFLRDHVWGGEAIIDIVKQTVQRDAYLERSKDRPKAGAPASAPRGPLPASLEPGQEGARTLPANLGLELELPSDGGFAFGQWYPAKAAPEVYVSAIEPGIVSSELLGSYRDRVKPLDSVESQALVYVAAFDLAKVRLGYEVGTEHPRVDWSDRVLPQMRDLGMPGPDGFDAIAPLVATGTVSPIHVSRTVATFTGGFKREHGAFRSGPLALVNHGSHYGWIEYGVVFSTLEPGLATLVVRDSGRIDMATWRGGDASELVGIEHARQSGVPIIEPDPIAGTPIPGKWVGNWSVGNWSGSVTGEERTVRSGICLQETPAGRYLLYAWFSSVTPSAMARVFQAYRCSYAMQLDMNALEHTYLALYSYDGDTVRAQHLVRGMEEVDRKVDGRAVPRFVGYPDNRDFFYVLRRQEDEP
ncbi:MAG TPA: hypothetical protein VMV37_13430 [Gammaproteobacteria bacterium]|nr:hypothetical protein [Gammaproteobacteria bacterium]